MKKIELAYLAGVMDSDGSFSIGIDRWRQRKFNRTPAYQEIVAIGQCDAEAIDLMQKLFGGAVRTAKSVGPNRRAVHYFQATNLIAVTICKTLLPYLRIKKRQAQIILSLRKIKNRGRKANSYYAGPRIRRIKPEIVAEMHILAEQIRQRNDSRFPLPLRK